MNDPSPSISQLEKATLAGGCFWCLEAVFKRLRGVEEVISGYMGGHVENPTYYQVCDGDTGHAEAIQIIFDPAVISYKELLDVFWQIHDPTTLDRQGNDIGNEYRSVIFHHSEEQKRTAEQSMEELAEKGTYEDPIVTQLEPVSTFYKADEEHQSYYDRNRNNGYCRIIIDPKVRKLFEKFEDKVKTDE